MKYAVVFEKGPTSYGAYVPDLPGCVAVGDTLKEVERLIQEAIEFHIEGMREDGDPIPEPTSTVKEIEVLRLIATGNANKEIAAQLSTSEEAVKSRVKNILDKLGANDRTHAVTIGLKRGIIDL